MTLNEEQTFVQHVLAYLSVTLQENNCVMESRFRVLSLEDKTRFYYVISVPLSWLYGDYYV